MSGPYDARDCRLIAGPTRPSSTHRGRMDPIPRTTPLLLALALLLLIGISPVSAVAARIQSGEEQAAADAAIALSELEATGDFDALYDRLHPDAQAIIPREVVVGWYANEFAPL